MSIRVICEKRHHQGEADISYPAFFCDLCDERILQAGNGNCVWYHPLPIGPAVVDPADTPSYYAERNKPLFLHKHCTAQLDCKARATQEAYIRVRGKGGQRFGYSANQSSMELCDFVLWLGRNAGLDLTDAAFS